jgi:Transposase DDE domain group 1
MRDGRCVTVEVTADGAGLVSHAGTALLGQVADTVGLTRALSTCLAGANRRRRGHDPGRVIRDLAVMLADGGECVSDLGAVREQAALFGEVASDSTAFRMVDRIAQTPGMLDALRSAHATARAQFWELSGAPQRLTIDVDTTLITAHSEKQRAAGTYKHGYGFHPLAAYADETREALAIMLRAGNAGSNTAADHVAVIDRSLAQIPDAQVEMIEILIRADSAGATHQTADHCHSCDLRFSFGYELTEPVRAAILHTPENAWIPALDQDGSERANGQVVELTDHVELGSWPQGSRVIVRRERPHPGAQLSFTDHDGHRFQAILTDQPDVDIQILERRHRQRARVEDRIRDDKDTGLAKLPFQAFALNEVWVQIVMLAHDLIIWTQALVLDGELATAEPKRLLHIAARLAFSARKAKLHLPAAWRWTEALKAAFEKLKTRPRPPEHQPPAPI